jgi:hypothetical protein
VEYTNRRHPVGWPWASWTADVAAMFGSLN